MCDHMTTAETSTTALSVNNIKLIIIKYANECNKNVWHSGNILLFQCTEILDRQTAIKGKSFNKKKKFLEAKNCHTGEMKKRAGRHNFF